MPRLSPPPAERKRRQIKALADFILENSGWVVSVEGANPIRFETANEALPGALEAMGYEARNSGFTERWLPVPMPMKELGRNKTIYRDQLVLTKVKIFQIELP